MHPKLEKVLSEWGSVIAVLLNIGGGVSLIPVALRKAKIAYNFGLSECNRVIKPTILYLCMQNTTHSEVMYP